MVVKNVRETADLIVFVECWRNDKKGFLGRLINNSWGKYEKQSEDFSILGVTFEQHFYFGGNVLFSNFLRNFKHLFKKI